MRRLCGPLWQEIAKENVQRRALILQCHRVRFEAPRIRWSGRHPCNLEPACCGNQSCVSTLFNRFRTTSGLTMQNPFLNLRKLRKNRFQTFEIRMAHETYHPWRYSVVTIYAVSWSESKHLNTHLTNSPGALCGWRILISTYRASREERLDR